MEETKMDDGEISETDNKPKKPKIDKDGFAKPPPRQTRKATASQQQQEVSTQNSFGDLSDSEMSIDEATNLPRKRPRKTTKPAASFTLPSTSTKDKPPNRPQAAQETSPKAAKPIIVTNTSVNALRNLFKSLSLSEAPQLRKRQGNDFSVYASCTADKKAIAEKLISQKIQHYTFTENEDRHLMFALFGHHEVATDELQEEIDEEMVKKKKEIKTTKVTQINKSAENPIFLVSFAKGSITLNELKHHHNILDGLRVRWERHEPKYPRPTQCKRCQRFGHAANNCQLSYRCVKCLLPHEPGQCARQQRDEGVPSCINCGVEGHASNSTICPAYFKHIESINARKKKPDQQQRTFSSARYNWNDQQQQNAHGFTNDVNNFPPIASQSAPSTSQATNNVKNTGEYRPSLSQARIQSQSQNAHKNDFTQFSNLQGEFLSLPDISETLRLFAVFVEDLKSAKNHGERIAVIMKHTGNKAQFSNSQE